LANFRIDRSQVNRVTFDLDHGLDPMLDLYLTTRASEVSPPLGRLSSFGSQTIDIRARVEGRASEISLDDPRPGIVALSSTPPRSEDEIFAILGSNVLATLGTSAGVAGLAGQGLISNFEDFLTDTLGLDEIRVGPVPIITGSGTQGLALGVEVARDLGTDISISAQI
jgi:translocation and assembly module TamB